MKFKIYLRKNNHLIQLIKVSRTKHGLYLFNSRSTGDDYTTYHEDGKFWSRRKGNIKHIKKIKQPLSEFNGTESLFTGMYSIYMPMPDDPIEQNTRIKSEDIIINRQEVNFCIEIILSEKNIALEKISSRINSRFFIKDTVFPIITIEVFDIKNRILPKERYPDKIKYTEGDNLFFEDKGRI